MTRKRGIFLVCLLALVAGVAFVFWNTLLNEAPPSLPQKLPDGETTIALTASRTGRKVEFRHGTFKERLFDYLLPTRGFKIGQRLYVPPNQIVKLESKDNRRLFLEFQFTQPGMNNVRIISIATPTSGGPVWGTGSGSGNSVSFSASVSGSVSVVTTSTATTIYTTPRTSRPGGTPATITLGSNGIATLGGVLPAGRFTVRAASGAVSGPTFFSMTSGAIYPPGEYRMILTGKDGFEYVEPFWPQAGRFTNGYVYVQPSMYPRQSRVINVRIEQRDDVLGPWQTVAKLETRNSPEGAHWWSAEKTPIRKSSGGKEFVLGDISVAEATFPNEFIGKYEARIPIQVLEHGHPLTNWEAFPLLGEDAGGNATPIGSFKTLSNGWLNLQSRQILNPSQVWRLRASFGRVSDFPASNLVSLTLPLPFNPGTTGALTTNLLGVPVLVRADNTDLHFELPANRADLRLNIVSAHWPDGAEIVGDGFRWNERHVGIDYSSHPAAGPLKLTLAIHPNFPIEFFVQPVNRISKK